MPRLVRKSKSKSKKKILKSARRKSLRTKSHKRKTMRHRSRRKKHDGGVEDEEYLWVFSYNDPRYPDWASSDWDRTKPEFNPGMYTWNGISYLISVKSHNKPVDTIYNYLVSKEYIQDSKLSEEQIKNIITRNTERKGSLYAQIINHDSFDSETVLEN